MATTPAGANLNCTHIWALTVKRSIQIGRLDAKNPDSVRLPG